MLFNDTMHNTDYGILRMLLLHEMLSLYDQSLGYAWSAKNLHLHTVPDHPRLAFCRDDPAFALPTEPLLGKVLFLSVFSHSRELSFIFDHEVYGLRNSSIRHRRSTSQLYGWIGIRLTLSDTVLHCLSDGLLFSSGNYKPKH